MKTLASLSKTAVGTGLIVVGLAASSLNAAMVNYTIGVAPGTLYDFTLHVDGVAESGYVGAITLNRTYEQSGVNLPQTLSTYCTDISGQIYIGQTYGFDLVSTLGQSGLSPRWGLTSANAQQAINNAYSLYYNNRSLSSSPIGAAALQIAIWEALYDTGGGFDLGNGRFGVTAGGSAAAQTAITQAASLLGTLSSLPKSNGYLLQPNPTGPGGGNYYQELMIDRNQFGYGVTPMGYDITPVPEASTLFAGAFATIPLIFGFVRRPRKPSHR